MTDQAWNKLLLRMKQTALEECQGVSIMTVKIIMRGGQPVGWSEPQVQRYQAPIRADLVKVLAEYLT